MPHEFFKLELLVFSAYIFYQFLYIHAVFIVIIIQTNFSGLLGWP